LITELQNSEETRLPVSIRAYAPGYVGAAFLFIFFGLLLLYLGLPILSLIAVLVGIAVVPVLAFTDKIVFDGRRLIRTGLLPKVWFKMNGVRWALKVRSIEQIDTAIVGTFKRGGRVRFLHRTTVFGNAPRFIFGGSGKRYREMSTALFSRVDTAMLDLRSLELSKYSTSPAEAVRIASELKIPASDVLENSLGSQQNQRSSNYEGLDPRLSDTSKADLLRIGANRLSAAGFLVRGIEAFRRALRLQPKNGWLLFEFARSLHLLAFVRKNRRFEHRAAAALRLAERESNGDTELLERIAETYRHFGYTRRAANAYQTVVDKIGDAFRSLIGLAEIALDEGRLAHVVHNFSAANRAASTAALRRWADSEAQYFTRLSGDDEYMELEVSRMNLLDKLDRWRRTMLRIAMYSLPLIVFGALFDESLVAEAGWLVSSIGFLAWVGMNIAIRMLSPRIPYDLVEDNE
jgi:hypothetical protein